MNPLQRLAVNTYKGINNIGKSLSPSSMYNPIPLSQIPAYNQKPAVQPLQTKLNLTNPPTQSFHQNLKGIPSYKKGGKVEKTGLAYLHKGETVIPKNMYRDITSKYKKEHPNSTVHGVHEVTRGKGDPDVYAKARSKALSNKVEDEKVTKRYSKKEENLKGKNKNQ
jgi:hypothetical protein